MDLFDSNPTPKERGPKAVRAPSPSLYAYSSSATVSPAGEQGRPPAGDPFINDRLAAQGAALRALYYEHLPEEAPQPSSPAARPAEVISTLGTIEDIFPALEAEWHRDSYLPSEEFSYPQRGPRGNCGAPFRAVRGCGCSVAAVRDHCDDKNCEHNYCADKNRRRRARDIEDKFEEGLRGRCMIMSIFTVPPALRQAAGEKVRLRARTKKDGTIVPQEAWRWQLWLDELIEGMKGAFCLEYAVERSDPAGEDRDKWHPHINLMWVKEDGGGFIEEEQLEALKSEWKRIIGEKEENPISVYTAYARPQDVNRRRHWYSYQGRTWPGWEEVFPYHCRVKWFGHPAKRPERELETHCPKCELEILVMKCGTEEAAAALAAKGYDNLKLEHDERLKALRRCAPAKLPSYTLVIDLN